MLQVEQQRPGAGPEHVPDPASIVQACADATAPGGDIIFATLNRNPKSYLFAIIGAEYLLRLLPVGTHQWSKFVKPDEIKVWARRSSLDVADFTGLHYNPFTRRYSLGGNLHVNYLVHLEKPARVLHRSPAVSRPERR